mmetsp:Transcript_51415/g.103257  ORF Transcript_51415/g.103257 Transcript_51415/m.103257 type:complete len:271 (+) Transcript_51415:54-866(+)
MSSLKGKELDDTIRFPEVQDVFSAPKLTEMLNAFDPFDARMLEGTQARFSKDKLKVDAMMAETERLTKCLADQVDVRRNMNQKLQKHCETTLGSFYAEFDGLVVDKTHLVEERLDALNERITALDEIFSVEKERINAEVDARMTELNETLVNFKKTFEEECLLRKDREAAIQAEMHSHEKEVEERFATESEARESVISQLRKELNESISSRRVSDVQFAAFVDSELSCLKESLASECAAREAEDDAVEKSLCTYTTKLQKSLRVLNSTDQ